MLSMMCQMFVMVRTYVINFDWEKILDFVGQSFHKIYLLIKRQSCHHTETSQWICGANYLTGFYVMATLTFKELITIMKFKKKTKFFFNCIWKISYRLLKFAVDNNLTHLLNTIGNFQHCFKLRSDFKTK